jgi:hypothetical protein
MHLWALFGCRRKSTPLFPDSAVRSYDRTRKDGASFSVGPAMSDKQEHLAAAAVCSGCERNSFRCS